MEGGILVTTVINNIAHGQTRRDWNIETIKR